NSEDPFGWVKQSLKIGAVCVAIGAISLIPVGNNPQGSGSFKAKNPVNIYPEITGKIREIFIQHDQLVTVGSPIARLETPDIEEQIFSEQRRLQDYERQLNQLKSQSFLLQARELEAQQATQNSAMETEILNQRAIGQSAEITRLNHQKSAITHRIQTLEGEVIYLQGERTRALEQLADYRKANQDGLSVVSVVPRNLIRDQESKVSNFENLIRTKIGQIKELGDELNGKDAEILALRNNWHEDAIRTEGQTRQSQAAEMTVRQQFYGNQQEFMDLTQAIQISKEKLAELEQRREEGQIVRSTSNGRIVTNNFHELLGRRMQEHEPIVQITQTQSLDLVIEIAQVDTSEDLVNPGAKIEITFPEDKSKIYDTIDSVDPEFKDDPTGQKRLKIARATIDNSDERFSLNQQVSVRIIGEKMPLYRKAWLEIRKHVPL
ncbi:MAG: hypothetical protein EA366_03260, partial [Spirulina sp. DLM2.Bin59]